MLPLVLAISLTLLAHSGSAQTTFSDAEATTVAKDDELAPFGDIFDSNEQQQQSLFVDDGEGVTPMIVGGEPVDPREYKVRPYDSRAIIVNPFLHPLNQLGVTYRHFLISPCSSLSGWMGVEPLLWHPMWCVTLT